MDGQHVQNSPHDLDLRPKHNYSILGDPQEVIKFQFSYGMSYKCMAIHDSGDIYVACSDNSIYVFDQAGHQKRTIGNGGSGDGQFEYLSAIAIRGDVIYVAENNKIQKLRLEGQLLKIINLIKNGSGQGGYIIPISVIVDHIDRIIVADQNHRVVILDQNGTWLLAINGNVSGSHSFQDPCGLALDPQGNIHVAANGSNAIKVFTPEGTYVRSYGDVKSPSGIAVDEEGYSMVCSTCGGYALVIGATRWQLFSYLILKGTT